MEKTLETNPEDRDAWFNKGTKLRDLGKLEEAKECFDKCLEINPYDVQASYNRRKIIEAKGKGMKRYTSEGKLVSE